MEEKKGNLCGGEDVACSAEQQQAREELKRREGMLRKLKALSSSMLKLADRRKRWTIRSGKVEAEWGDAVQERRRMRVELETLIRKVRTASGKLSMQVARMKVQVHIEWMEELDARGKRLEVEVKELLKELEEIGKLRLGQEKEEQELRKDLADELTYKRKRTST